MDVIFRAADLNKDRDIEALVILINEFMFGKDTGNAKSIDSGIAQKLKKIGTAKIYLCECYDNIIGIAVCFIGFSTYRQKELLNIHDFFIQKEYQGKGIGTRFLEYIEEECIKNDFCRITLEAYDDNTNAIKLYVNNGFQGNKNIGNNHLIYAMKKELN